VSTQSSVTPIGASTIQVRDEVAQTYSKVKRRLLPFLMLSYLMAIIDRSNIGYARLQFMEALSFNEGIFGTGVGLFYAGYSLFEVPSNLMLTRAGIRVTFLRIMVLWGLFCAAIAFMQGPTQFYVLRFLLGAAEAGLFPGLLLYLTFWFPPEVRARVTATCMAAIPVAALIGGPLAGTIMKFADGLLGLQGWQWLFLVEGLPACLLGPIAYLYLDNGPKDAEWLTPRERDIIARDLARDDGQVGAPKHSSPYSAFWDRRVYLFCLPALSILTGAISVAYWIPTIIQKSGVHDVFRVGLLSATPSLIGIVSQYLIAWHSDRHQERRWHATVSLLVAAVGWATLAAVQPGTVGAVILLTLCTAGAFGAAGPFWALPGEVIKGSSAAASIALVTTLASLGSVFIPLFVGWLFTKTGGYQAGQYAYAVIIALGAIMLPLTVRSTRPPAAASTKM